MDGVRWRRLEDRQQVLTPRRADAFDVSRCGPAFEAIGKRHAVKSLGLLGGVWPEKTESQPEIDCAKSRSRYGCGMEEFSADYDNPPTRRRRTSPADEAKIAEFIRKHGVTLCPPCRSEELKHHCFLLLRKELAEAWRPPKATKKRGKELDAPSP
jgi:hypothetical protein